MGMRSPVAGGARGGDAGRLADPLLAANGVKDECWVPADEEEMLPSHGEDGQRPLLFRTFKVKATVLYLYRLMSLARMIAIILFVIWRMKHQDSDAMWLWWFTIFGDFWFGVSWLINQVPKLNPIKCIPNLSHLRQQFDLPNGSSILPGLDVFINTVDPVDEPMIYTMNSVLSILATDYPVERHAIYFSDDGGSLVHYEGLLETAKFAALWVPFCRKHCVEPRAPERYFMMKTHPYIWKQHDEFLDDHRRVRRDYEEFKVRLDALFTIIPQRSEVYNRANTKEGGANATWMENGTRWPGTWIEPTEDHSKGHHAEIIQVLLNHPGNEPELGMPSSSDNRLDFSSVDMRLPMLVYMAREKLPCYDHQKKAGAMNVQLRVSALLSNAPFIINFDGDHYVNNSQAFRAAMCFFLDRRAGAGDTAFVQFPQRFDDVDPTDRYCNHNRVFFDATLLGLNGIQGPSYVGTGCMFRRVALYGADPPRWRPDDGKVLDRRPSKFGKSIPFLNSMLVAAVNQERSITSVPLDVKLMSELFDVMACTYEDGTEWGGSVGWVYNVATEDLATGLRLHRAGWRSTYYAMDPDAFRGTAPINLTERLYQILRWSGGSMEVFFSGLCPILAGRRLMPLQRVAYTNMTAYPISALLIFVYGLFPAMWLSHGMFYIQKPFLTYVLYVVGIIAMTEVIGMVEIRWAGLTVREWFRNEQFYMIGATGVYPTAVLHVLLRSLGMEGVSFKLTAKQLATSARERFAELYDVQWAPLLAPTAVVMVVNAAAIGVAIGKAVAGGWSAEQVGDAAAGLVFNVWILLLLYPFALGVTGRWSKRPYILFTMWWARLLSSRSRRCMSRSSRPPRSPAAKCRSSWDIGQMVPFLRRDGRCK